MNKNPHKRARNENFLKSKIPTDGERPLRFKSQIRIAKELGKSTRNRCCYVRPKQIHFGQVTEQSIGCTDAFLTVPSIDQYSNLITKQNDIDSGISNETSRAAVKLLGNSTSVTRQNVDSVQDIEQFVQEVTRDEAKKHSLCVTPEHIRISGTPRVMKIVEKFSKFKRDNIEIRRLDEKVVCVEYDVFNQEPVEAPPKPIQKIRAFFSIKPDHEDIGQEFPLKIKQEFKLLDEDLTNLTDEIEILDDQIEENKSYLEDLRRILKRNQSIDAKKHKSSLDLKYLYEMAKRANCNLNRSVTNFLSQAELEEMKGLILEQCKSSVHGISRRKIKSGDSADFGMGSGSIAAVLLRENGKIDVFK